MEQNEKYIKVILNFFYTNKMPSSTRKDDYVDLYWSLLFCISAACLLWYAAKDVLQQRKNNALIRTETKMINERRLRTNF